MTAYTELPESRQALIRHNIIREIYSRLKREDVMALLAVAYIEVTLYQPFRQGQQTTMSQEEVHMSYKAVTDMYSVLLQTLQQRAGIDVGQICRKIMADEGVSVPGMEDVTAAMLLFLKDVMYDN